MVWSLKNILINLVNLATGVIGVILALRIVLRLFGANPLTPAVAWIYTASSRLMYPFNGIAPSFPLAGLGVIDAVALISLMFYVLLGYLVITAVNAIFKPLEERYVNRYSPTYHDLKKE